MATVTGTPPVGPDVSDLASAAVVVIHPAIQISKTPATQAVAAGGTATFTIAVTNSGDVGLTGVAVTDPLTPGCDKTIGALAAGASYPPYTCTLTNVTAGFTNVATVTGHPPAGPDVNATASAAVDVINPAIQISKSPDPQPVRAGGTATFTIVVSNIGAENLTSVAVTDPLAPGCNRTIGALAAGASYPTYTCTLANVTADFTNRATVTGRPPGGQTVTDSDSAAVQVINPAIQISKTPATQQVVAGGTANFNIRVTNTGAGNGNLTLTGVTVSDPLAPNCNRSFGTLAKAPSSPTPAASLTSPRTSPMRPPSPARRPWGRMSPPRPRRRWT